MTPKYKCSSFLYERLIFISSNELGHTIFIFVSHVKWFTIYFRYILHFTIGTGGFRDLMNSRTRQFYRQDIYTAMQAENTMELRFDYDDPVHCSEDRTCSSGGVPLHLTEDITKVNYFYDYDVFRSNK